MLILKKMDEGQSENIDWSSYVGKKFHGATTGEYEILKLEKYSAVEIDNALWLITQVHSSADLPYHRTYGIYY